MTQLFADLPRSLLCELASLRLGDLAGRTASHAPDDGACGCADAGLGSHLCSGGPLRPVREDEGLVDNR